MKKSILLPALILFGSLLFSFTTIDSSVESELGFLPANCENPVFFQIDSQQPFSFLEVNPSTGQLFISNERLINGLCGNYDGDNNEDRVKVNYSVTNADGERHGGFIIIDLEQEE